MGRVISNYHLAATQREYIHRKRIRNRSRLNRYQIVLVGFYLAFVGMAVQQANQGVLLNEIVLEIVDNMHYELIDSYKR